VAHRHRAAAPQIGGTHAAKTNPDEGALMRTVEVALSVLD
jgi:hypothetical protein